jgi:hypothetical protein
MTTAASVRRFVDGWIWLHAYTARMPLHETRFQQPGKLQWTYVDINQLNAWVRIAKKQNVLRIFMPLRDDKGFAFPKGQKV